MKEGSVCTVDDEGYWELIFIAAVIFRVFCRLLMRSRSSLIEGIRYSFGSGANCAENFSRSARTSSVSCGVSSFVSSILAARSGATRSM